VLTTVVPPCLFFRTEFTSLRLSKLRNARLIHYKVTWLFCGSVLNPMKNLRVFKTNSCSLFASDKQQGGCKLSDSIGTSWNWLSPPQRRKIHIRIQFKYRLLNFTLQPYEWSGMIDVCRVSMEIVSSTRSRTTQLLWNTRTRLSAVNALCCLKYMSHFFSQI